MDTQTTTSRSVGSGALFCWIDSNRTRGFPTWDAEIAHMQSLGYELVPPDHHIPHWSKAEGARRLYVNGRDGPRELAAFFNRPARDLGYPLLFKQNTEMSHAHPENPAVPGVGAGCENPRR